jgi:NADPH:quinone reductase-like Zn-dependent oxidoreductase
MKAVITKKYGTAEVLELQEVEKPTIKENEILINVRAFSINPVDWKVRRGDVKILTGRKPPKILGADYSGIVTDVGKSVTKYKIGDAVFGNVHAFKGGAYAEFLKVKDELTCLKPDNLSFEEAASIPIAALTSYQSLVHEGKMKPGDHVMINGCSGGVGVAGVQIANAFNCIVTGVCSTKNIEFTKKLGIDNIIDYTREDILKDNEAYNIFLDAVGNQSFSNVKATLKPRGIYITTLPSVQNLLLSPFINFTNSKKVKKVMITPSKKCAKDLQVLKEIAESGKIIPVIEKIYPVEQIQDAHIRSESGRVVGKIVVSGFSK